MPMTEVPKINSTSSFLKSGPKPPMTPGDKDKKKKKGLFGGLFGKKKGKETAAVTPRGRSGSRTKRS
jgi:hypothetical protein